MSDLKFRENDLVEFRGGALHRVVSVIDPAKKLYEVAQEAAVPAWAKVQRLAHESELRATYARKCECGVDYIGGGRHSGWCPAYRVGT
jgi:hypothetical protein